MINFSLINREIRPMIEASRLFRISFVVARPLNRTVAREPLVTRGFPRGTEHWRRVPETGCRVKRLDGTGRLAERPRPNTVKD